MDQPNYLNVYTGPDSVQKYYNPDILPPLPLVEVPDVLNPFRSDGVRIYAKMMSVHPANNVKALPAMNLLAESINPKQKTIIEYSSGSTAISMSLIARIFHKTNDTRAYLSNKTSQAKLRLMQFFGLDLTLFGGPSQPEPLDKRGGICRAQEHARINPVAVNPNQYENYANWQAHEKWTGPQILRQLPEIDVVCAGMGTSGTMTGIGAYMKRAKPSVHRLAVCTAAGDRVPGPRSLALMAPVNFPWREAVDSIEHVGSVDSYSLSMRLSREGLICGPSSGLNLKGLYQFLEKRREANNLHELTGEDDCIHCVFICCDLPYQYINEYFAKLGPENFPPIHNPNLTDVDLYRYDEAWERDALDALLSVYDIRPDHRRSMPQNCYRIPSLKPPAVALKSNSLLIDLRTAGDFAQWHLPCAINMPLASLSPSTPNPFSHPFTLEQQWRELEALFQRGDDDGASQAATNSSARFAITALRGQLVFLFCYDGDTARVATSVLRAKGIEADSVRGGLRALLREWPELVEDNGQSEGGEVGSSLVAVIDQAWRTRAVA